ncbi:hypothetical protein KI688_007580 [Linnemannia hyalina]|uniref:DUF6589 domain-containing protein n=1 Tax=Linnemannia hyalina TaxID=64524 RepID=A0A9P8BPU0_9FUNG|nr:hypothetical protein KI688_007580 [Linnemannia hyalina]
MGDNNDNIHSEEDDDSNEDAFWPVARFHLFNVLQKSHEPYRMFVTAFKIPDGTLLGSTPTMAFEIGLLDIGQSTVAGNIQVIEHVQELLDLPEEFFVTRKLGLVGDLLTISRFHSAKQRRASEIDSLPSDRWEWAVLIFGLFHLQMTTVKVIMRTHYGSHDTSGSLAYNISLLDRKRIDQDAKFYHDAKELLISSFYAMVRRIWLVMMGKADSTSGLAEGLEEMRRDLGGDDSQVQEKLIIMAKSIYDTYFVRHSVLLDTLCPADVNAALFIKDTVIYLELCAAIKHRDINRLQAILKPLTITMSAGGSPYYALELLRMYYGVRYAWTNLRTEAIFSSMLMNTKGAEDSFIPLDLYREFNNKLVKECIKRQGSNRSMESLKNVTTPNIRLLDTIATDVEDELGVPFNSAFHRTTSTDDYIRAIINSLVKHDILSGEVRPKAINSDEVIVKNLMDVTPLMLVASASLKVSLNFSRRPSNSPGQELSRGLHLI